MTRLTYEELADRERSYKAQVESDGGEWTREIDADGNQVRGFKVATRLTDEELQELERLERAATPGPWTESRGFLFRDDGDHVGTCEYTQNNNRAGFVGMANASLIANTRNALPLLLAEVRELRRQLQWERDHSCENTPTPGCDCPGCSLTREECEGLP